jgi:hypothetical protein
VERVRKAHPTVAPATQTGGTGYRQESSKAAYTPMSPAPQQQTQCWLSRLGLQKFRPIMGGMSWKVDGRRQLKDLWAKMMLEMC